MKDNPLGLMQQQLVTEMPAGAAILTVAGQVIRTDALHPSNQGVAAYVPAIAASCIFFRWVAVRCSDKGHCSVDSNDNPGFKTAKETRQVLDKHKSCSAYTKISSCNCRTSGTWEC